MNSYSLAHLGHPEIQTWLMEALQDKQPLPRVTADESPHLAILRMELTQEPQVRRSLQLACKDLLRAFCKQPEGESRYHKELLALVAKLEVEDSLSMLAEFSKRFQALPHLSFEIRNAVLGVLSAGLPPQPYEFWHELLLEDRERYASRAVSGALSGDKFQALQLLAELPNSEHLGETTALKLELALDYLEGQRRDAFIRAIAQALPSCAPLLAAPILQWLKNLEAPKHLSSKIIRMAHP